MGGGEKRDWILKLLSARKNCRCWVLAEPFLCCKGIHKHKISSIHLPKHKHPLLFEMPQVFERIEEVCPNTREVIQAILEWHIGTRSNTKTYQTILDANVWSTTSALYCPCKKISRVNSAPDIDIYAQVSTCRSLYVCSVSKDLVIVNKTQNLIFSCIQVGNGV